MATNRTQALLLVGKSTDLFRAKIETRLDLFFSFFLFFSNVNQAARRFPMQAYVLIISEGA